MIDKELEHNIKKTKDFMEIWGKSRRIFKNMISGNHVDTGKEEEFASVKDLLNSRYEDLMDALGVKPLRRFTMNQSVCNILELGNISIMSDEKLKSADRDWAESQKFFETLFERLKRKKRRIEGFNRFFLSVKRKIAKK